MYEVRYIDVTGCHVREYFNTKEDARKRAKWLLNNWDFVATIRDKRVGTCFSN